jgi:outer membrane protein assembly factor BamB
MGGLLSLGTSLVLAVTPLTAQSPQFRGNAAHTGDATVRPVERFGGVAWRFRTDGTVRSTAALADGTVYVGSSDGFLYALAAVDGQERWRFDVGGAVVSAPAVSGSAVLVASREGVLHGVARSSGRSLWRLETGDTIPLPWGHEGFDYIHGSPALAGGVAYWGSGDGVLRALDPQTGRASWTFATGGRIRSTPAVSDGLLVVGSGDGLVYGLDAASGRERWQFRTEGAELHGADFGYDRRQIFSSPVIDRGVVYVGSRDARLYALDALDGSELWRVEEGSAWVVSTPTVAGERVYSARSSSGNVRAVDRATGEELWRFSAGSFVHASPVLAGGLLYLARGDGRLTALDAGTGEPAWEYPTGGGIYATPVADDGRVYVGSDDGYVYAFAAAEGPALRRAVFHDEALASRAVFGGSPADRRVRDHFVARGYELLDGAGLVDFLEARAGDRAPSVVVFAMDVLPDDADPDENGWLVERYLRAGGKVVWLGFLPGYLVRDPDTGQPVATDRDAASDLLGVNLSAYDGDSFTVAPTETGRRWGLDTWWVGQGTTRVAHVTEVLAADELGRAAVWVKGFGGRTGTGFAYVRMTPSGPPLDAVQRVAEYGLAGVAQGR